MLNIIIPLRNEEENLNSIVNKFEKDLDLEDYQVLLINDFSEDGTFAKAKLITESKKNFFIHDNTKKGLGGAITLGIEKSDNKYTAIMMADSSDDIKDLKKYYQEIQSNNVDAVFGSRFLKESKVENYPITKLILNRVFNNFVRLIFLNKYNDFTNAFKIYKTQTLKSLSPLVSESFNIFLEIPLKVISRGYSFKIIPINWYNRKKGQSKFDIKELGSKYLFTLLYCFLEKILLRKKK